MERAASVRSPGRMARRVLLASLCLPRVKGTARVGRSRGAGGLFAPRPDSPAFAVGMPTVVVCASSFLRCLLFPPSRQCHAAS